MSRPPLPSFLIIGAQKSATRWLRDNLGEHPAIYTARTEISYFNNPERYDDLGIEWYRSQFEGWEGEPLVGEATPGYLMWRHEPDVVARRIRKTLGRPKLIAILRNPIDRTESAVRHHIKHGRLPRETDVLELVRSVDPEDDPLGLIAGGWYAASLQPFRRRFRGRVLVALHDDVVTAPDRVYRSVLEHLGAEADYRPPDLDAVVFSTQPDKAEHRRPPLTPEERLELWPYFAEDVARLEQMLRRDLSIWTPPG